MLPWCVMIKTRLIVYFEVRLGGINFFDIYNYTYYASEFFVILYCGVVVYLILALVICCVLIVWPWTLMVLFVINSTLNKCLVCCTSFF